MKNYIYGLKKGFPIFLGYLPVSFTFGFMAVSGGLPVWMAVFISVTNLTSAGQAAGLQIIAAGGTLLDHHGWGLSIVRQIAERRGGRLTTERSDGQFISTVWLGAAE